MSATGEYKEAIKALRASTGLSQKAFAEKFDIPKRTIENWEGGQTDPPGYVVRLLKQAIEAEQAQGEVSENRMIAEALYKRYICGEDTFISKDTIENDINTLEEDINNAGDALQLVLKKIYYEED